MFAAPTLAEEVAIEVPEGMRLIHLSHKDREDMDMALAAMRAAGKPGRLLLERLDRGDRFFGWMDETGVCTSGWTCHRDREIGARRYLWERRRAFLYDFHTRPANRGRGLFRALLLQLRRTLRREEILELVIDARMDDLASVRGILSAGFRPIERMTVDTWLDRWHLEP